MSTKEESVPPTITTSCRLVRSAASKPIYGDRSRNRKNFTAYPTPSGSSACKASIDTMNAMEWEIRCIYRARGNSGFLSSGGIPPPLLPSRAPFSARRPCAKWFVGLPLWQHERGGIILTCHCSTSPSAPWVVVCVGGEVKLYVGGN